MPIRTTTPDQLQVARFLPGLPASAIAEVATGARATLYRAGETVMGGPGRATPAVVAEGTVRLTIRAKDGREAVLRQVGCGTWLGLTTLFQAEPRPVPVARFLVAGDKSTVIFFDPAVISRLGREHSDFTMHLIHSLVDWGLEVTDAAGRLAFMSVRQRVAAHLVGLAVPDPNSGGSPVARITQQELADAVGSVREVVARTLRDFRLGGLISVTRARIAVLDQPALSQMALGVR